MKKDAMIIGSSLSGIQASQDLANLGFKVHLLESSPFLRRSDKPTPPDYINNTRLMEVARNPNIRIWTNSNIVACEGNAGNFQATLVQHPRFVDPEKCTACGDCIEVCPVTLTGTNRKAVFLDGQPGIMAIDKLGTPPCANACPGGIHVQGYIALIAQGRFQEAIDLIREAIPFPGICGRVCTHPCELNCRRNEIDEPVAVRLLKRFVSDWEIKEKGMEVSKANSDSGKNAPSGKRVAIVGAGPGGMTVADRLTRLGYRVTVFEKNPVVGGMLAIGIPEYRLPHEVIEREIRHIQDLGVEIKLNTTIGPGGRFSLDDLFREGYEAICLAVGAQRGQSLEIPGANFPGVVQGVEILKLINLSHLVGDTGYEKKLIRYFTLGPNTKVAVIGGGNTAMDVSRSIKQLGLNQVKILYRRSRLEMPSMPEEIEEAEKEGVEIDYLVSPVRILGSPETGITGLECQRMKLGRPDSSGRRRPEPIQGSNFTTDADLVILAIGQTTDLSILDNDADIGITPQKRIKVSKNNFMTSRPGVFAVGDAVTRDKMVVIEAIGMGKKAAAAIDLYLRSGKCSIKKDKRRQIAKRKLTPNDQLPIPRTQVRTLPLEKRFDYPSEVELGFTADEAMEEAQRCLACGPCSECLACVQVCKVGAINHDQEEKRIDLDIGAIIFADQFDHLGLNDEVSRFVEQEKQGIYQISPENMLFSSAIVYQAVQHLIGSTIGIMGEAEPRDHKQSPKTQLEVQYGPSPNPLLRNGIFICQCGPEDSGRISRIIDTEQILKKTKTWPSIVYSQLLSHACTEEGTRIIQKAIKKHDINRVVVAGCTCCSIDQVCFSCTYQRIRCKHNLELFIHPEFSSASATTDQGTKFVFLNIREQCAWPHVNNPQEATEKATALISGSIARVMANPSKAVNTEHVSHSTLILGNGAAGGECIKSLREYQLQTIWIKKPESIQKKNGRFTVTEKQQTWEASSLVLTPADPGDTKYLLGIFNEKEYQPRIKAHENSLETHRPGIYFIDPAKEPSIAAQAVATRVAGWLINKKTKTNIVSVVNPSRCRSCGTCIEICEFGAPEIVEVNDHNQSWIDPAICTGCGICAAHCPSGAITAGYSTDTQIEAMLSAILESANGLFGA